MKIAFLFAAVLSAPAAMAFAPVRVRVRVQDKIRQPRSGDTRLAAYIEIGEQVGRDVGSFDEWATNYQIQKGEGFQLTSEDGLDWSVMTTQDLPQGTPVLYVPGNMLLSTSGARAEFQELGNVADAVSFLTRLGANSEVPQFYLYLKILKEYESGDQSPYFPWLNSLPRLYYNAVSMTDFCYECLPPLVFRLAREERVKCDNFFDALQKVDFISDQIKGNKDLTKWAFNAVYTRAWGPDNEKQIVPMADMFNHGTDPEVAISYDEEGNCFATTIKDVPAGSPLRMSYGCPTNPSHFFATYGFLDETAPATFCKIMNIKPNKELLDIGFDFSRMLFYKDTGDISEEVWDVMLYQILTNNRPVQEMFYQAHMNGDAETKSGIHQQYFLQTATALKTHVDTFLKTLDELSAKGDGIDWATHPRLPLILAHNDFVKTTFLKVKARLDPMVAEAGGEPVQYAEQAEYTEEYAEQAEYAEEPYYAE